MTFEPHGLTLFISSAVPEGKGVSSSAALEVACMQAVCAACGIQLQGDQCALLCQKVGTAALHAKHDTASVVN